MLSVWCLGPQICSTCSGLLPDPRSIPKGLNPLRITMLPRERNGKNPQAFLAILRFSSPLIVQPLQSCLGPFPFGFGEPIRSCEDVFSIAVKPTSSTPKKYQKKWGSLCTHKRSVGSCVGKTSWAFIYHSGEQEERGAGWEKKTIECCVSSL